MARKLKIMVNEKHPLDDMKNDEITEKRENEKCNYPTFSVFLDLFHVLSVYF